MPGTGLAPRKATNSDDVHTRMGDVLKHPMHDEKNSFTTKIQKPNKDSLSNIDSTHRLVGNFADLPPLGSSWPKGKSLNKKNGDNEWQTSTNPQSEGSWAKPPGRVTTSTSSNPQSEGSWAKPPGRVCNNTFFKVDAENFLS